MGNTKSKNNQDCLSICAGILPGGKLKIYISETTDTSLTNKGQMKKPKGGLQERPGKIPDQMETIRRSTHPNVGHQ